MLLSKIIVCKRKSGKSQTIVTKHKTSCINSFFLYGHSTKYIFPVTIIWPCYRQKHSSQVSAYCRTCVWHPYTKVDTCVNT